MNRNSASKLFVAAGVLCFALAFVMLSAFKGRFGPDTAGVSSVPSMEEPLEVVPQKSTKSAGSAEDAAPRRVRSVSQSEPEESESRWMVYVTGAVKKPGVYEVARGARVYEALNAAGGFADGADQDAVNLAAKLSDGEHVRFPRKGEQKPESAPVQNRSDAGNAASSAGRTAKVNINTAGKSELRSIRGVGAKTAQLILDYRKENGPFGRTEDIMNVSGIGPKRYEEIKDQITVGY
ncbi:MAG: helix-hairpin-helix domain-containing protein [Synergistes sp.]|nr:helix-hairpin-helix domain-containing protein [Synergistes sp.]